jgi:hypothetical protein
MIKARRLKRDFPPPRRFRQRDLLRLEPAQLRRVPGLLVFDYLGHLRTGFCRFLGVEAHELVGTETGELCV